jgi:hypothetical protein
MLLLLLAACDTTLTSTTDVCTLGAPAMSVAEAAPGDTVTLTLSPLTEAWDTVITVGPDRATILDLDRSTCDACDTCREDAECTTCGECTDCEASCDTCVETVQFIVPALSAGIWPVQLTNLYGRSQPVDLTIPSGADTGADTGTDTGADTGTDTGADTGTDTGADTGTDTGADTGTDTGTDTGSDGGGAEAR